MREGKGDTIERVEVEWGKWKGGRGEGERASGCLTSLEISKIKKKTRAEAPVLIGRR